MAPIYNFRYPITFYFGIAFFCCYLGVVPAESSPSFGFKKFDQDSLYFKSQISLYGDARVNENGSFIQITRSWNYSAGRVMFKEPIKLMEANPRRKVSFQTYFAFSLSPEEGDGLAFVILRNGFASDTYYGRKNKGFFGVEFDTRIDPDYGDLNDNHVGINVGSLVSVKVTNVSDAKLVLNSGDKLQCWIDYEASSKRIEVRISKWGDMRPVSPAISCPIDLSVMFKNDNVFVGLSSSNANSTQVCKLYSWSFKLRPVPTWMHSQPLDPQVFSKDAEPVVMHKRSDCILRVLTALIFGTGCGALGAFIVLCVWGVFGTKKPVVPAEYVVQPVVYDYDKVKVIVVDKSSTDRK